MEISKIAQAFRETRSSIHTLDVPNGSGVYAIYLRNPEAVRKFHADSEGLIYVG